MPAPDVRMDQVSQENGPTRTATIAALIDRVRNESGRYSAIQELLRLCEQHLISSEELVYHAEVALGIWHEINGSVEAAQRDVLKVEWLLDSDYEPLRAKAEWLLDLLGYLPGISVTQALRDALRLSDPRLKLFAVDSLLRRGESVAATEIEAVAASNEMRETLWTRLGKLGLRCLMPPRWSTSKALATSALTRWLAHPNELNAIPEEVELMRVFSVKTSEGALGEVYLFRFREFPKPWEPGEGWMAGIAGPYVEDRPIGPPCSSFTRWDSLPPERHFQDLYLKC